MIGENILLVFKLMINIAIWQNVIRIDLIEGDHVSLHY